MTEPARETEPAPETTALPGTVPATASAGGKAPGRETTAAPGTAPGPAAAPAGGAAPAHETALITGATAGLGAEFAQQLAAKRFNLVLVARDAARLESKAVRLRQEFGVAVETISADLQTDDGVASVAARLRQTADPVTMLVNNAGFGLAKSFEENTVEEESAHLQILVAAPMQLTHAALQEMLALGHGRIINVASVAGFISSGSYSACKAWIINFSKWANAHYSPRGVRVTAVCPGFVHTEFHQRMGASMASVPQWMWLNPEQVVREGLADAMAGKAVSVPSRRYKVLAALGKIAPARFTAGGPGSRHLSASLLGRFGAAPGHRGR